MNLKHKYVQLNLLKTCLTRFELRYKMIVVIPHEIIHRLFLSLQLLPNYICFFIATVTENLEVFQLLRETFTFFMVLIDIAFQIHRISL